MVVVIIDDEVKARSLLRNLLEQYCNEYVQEIGEGSNLKEGVKLIKKMKPDLVLLDIEMPDEQGIEIYKYFENDSIDFELVFTTAFSEYAITAFELNAFDYLLKPIRPKRLKEVVDEVRNKNKSNDIGQRLEELKSALKNGQFNKIGLPVKEGYLFVPLDEIEHIEAEGMYTNVYLHSGKKEVVSKPLKFFDSLLKKGKTFYRPHRSHIINMTYLKQYVRREGNYIILENDAIIPVSKEKREEFLQLVSSI